MSLDRNIHAYFAIDVYRKNGDHRRPEGWGDAGYGGYGDEFTRELNFESHVPGFYAAAYIRGEGEIVIAYRGTDEPSDHANSNSGFGVAPGIPANATA
ncbi:MAG: hypothetical protein ACFB2Z_04915 [Maricaulaceae bacterium]